MKIFCMSRSEIKNRGAKQVQRQFPGEAKVAVISIRDVQAQRVKLYLRYRLFGMLELAFDDDCYGDLAISPQQATDAVQFIRSASAAGVEALAVHCFAGQSRSAAVAAAASEMLGQPSDEFFSAPFEPNPRVYNLVLSAAGITPARALRVPLQFACYGSSYDHPEGDF